MAVTLLQYSDLFRCNFSFLPGTIRILASFAYMGIFSVISNQGDPEYMLTPEFVVY